MVPLTCAASNLPKRHRQACSCFLDCPARKAPCVLAWWGACARLIVSRLFFGASGLGSQAVAAVLRACALASGGQRSGRREPVAQDVDVAKTDLT